MAELVDSIAESDCSSPSSSDRWARAVRARDGGAPVAGVQQAGLTVIPRSCVRPRATTFCGTPCWRTCTGPSSTRWKRRRRTSRCWRTSAARRRSWPVVSSGARRSHTFRLLRLPPTVQRRVAAGVLSAGRARALLALPDQGSQERLAQRVVAEGLSVRATEEIVMLGDAEEPSTTSRSPRSAREPHPRASEIAGQLADRLDTRVKVDSGRAKGRLTIEFASPEDLERIAELLLR